jgi:hypothetical protein
MSVNVLLDKIAGLGAPSVFGPASYQTTFASCAVSADGRAAYFGRTASYDPGMRNLVVASLDASGDIVGIPQCYPTSGWSLAPINGYPISSGYNTTITAILVNPAKSRLYLGESRSAVQPTTSGLNVYTLDAQGKPTGGVRTYADGNIPGHGTISGLVIHPSLPLLYMVGWGMAGVAVQALDKDGEPRGAPSIYSMGPYGKTSLGISGDAKYLYMGTHPDTLEVVSLDGDGNPTGAVKPHPVNNTQVGMIGGYLQFTMGSGAIYMVRPNPTGSGLPILALWPLDSTTGQPIGSALARTDVHPPLVGAGTMTIAVDKSNHRLWVAAPTTFADAFTGATIVSGITPTSYAINADGTLGSGTAGPSLSQLSNTAVLVPAGNPGSPLFFNDSVATIGNRVRGYQCRITVTAVSGGSFPLTMNTNQGIAFGILSALNTPSAWVGLDALLKDKNHQVPVQVFCSSPLTSMTVRFDLADSSGHTLKSVTETVQSSSAAFLMPGYGMSAAALTGSVTGLETYSERSADYLRVANLNPVAVADRPKQIITDCYQLLGGEANNAVLTNLAQTLQAVGFNTVNAYGFDGLGAADINKTLTANGLSKRSNASYAAGRYGSYLGGCFSFDALSGMTKANLADWAKSLVSKVATSNGGLPSQIESIHMTDEPGWYYPSWIDQVNDTVHYSGYLQAFQNYLRQQGATYGFTYTDLGGTDWSSLRPIGQSAGNPLTGGPASIQKRRLYYWTMRFYADAAGDGMKMAQQALTAAVGHPVATPVNWNNQINRWYIPSPNAKIANNKIVNADSAMGMMDWMRAGRTSAHTAWTEDWFGDTQANTWSVCAAAMRSATQAGTQGFGGYVVGKTMGQMPAGGKYKIFPLLGSGAKNYCGYTFGPWFQFGDGWSENSSKLAHGTRIIDGDVYSEYADANRLIGRSERILYQGVPERSKVAILLPGASELWDTTQKTVPYYVREVSGLYYAISHGYNITVDFVDDTDIANGALTNHDYYVLYVIGPNVSAAAQKAIITWINTLGTHNRQLVLAPGAAIADEYNTATTGFDALAGSKARSRSWTALRDATPSYPSTDPYTATIQNTNAAFYFNGQKMNIRGPFQALQPLPGVAGPSWTDQVYATGSQAGQPGCVTKEYIGSGVSNYVTAFGFFPGWQYYASPNSTYTDHLPQDWSIMAREVAMMPVIRQNPPRTVHIYNGKGPVGQTLTENNEYLTTCPVEALRVNVGGSLPTAIGVVLLNWGGTPFSELKFKVLDGLNNPATFILASGALLSDKSSSCGTNAATMTLYDVDVVLISK